MIRIILKGSDPFVSIESCHTKVEEKFILSLLKIKIVIENAKLIMYQIGLHEKMRFYNWLQIDISDGREEEVD